MQLRQHLKLWKQRLHRWHINWRMQKAKAQLENSDMAMIDIAETAGYSSEAAFSKAFKHLLGLPPGQVRRSSNA